jgi:hypothetical protein
MRPDRTTRARLLSILAIAACLALVVPTSLSVGCLAKKPSTGARANPQSALGEKAKAPVPPGHLDLATPEQAVVAYLKTISYAYRLANSSIALPTMTDNESVRVDSYVELNREASRTIEQELLSFRVKSVKIAAKTATVTAAESWRYRYIDIKTRRYRGPEHVAKYDTVYKLARSKKGWLVDSVDATALTPIE